MNLYTRLWLSHHMSKLKWEFAFEGWTFKNESAYRSANRLPGRCWQVLKLGTWLRIKLMRSTQIGKSLQKPLGCHQIVPSSDPSSLAGSTHSDVSPWSLHQKKHYSNPNCQETWWSKCLNFVLKTTNHSKVNNHTRIMHSQRDVYSYCRPKYINITQTPQRQLVFAIATRIRSSWCSSWFSRVMCLDDSIGDDVDMNMKTQPYDWRKRTWTEKCL